MKKLLSLALALVMILSLSVTAFATTDWPDPFYVDIGQYADPNKTVTKVMAKFDDRRLESMDLEADFTHVDGMIYSATQIKGYDIISFRVCIYYGEEDCAIANIDFDSRNGKNQYTITGAWTGTWSTYSPTGPSVTNGNKNVTGKYVAGAESKTIYKVDISWGDMAFTYTAASKGTWNTTDHVYKDGTEAGWSWADGANKIQVTNHSNAGIVVTPSYTPETAYTDVKIGFDRASLPLATADNGESGAAGTPTDGTITVTPSGSLPENTSNQTVGSIALKIQNADAVVSLTTDKKEYCWDYMGFSGNETLEDVVFTVTYANGTTKTLKKGDEGLTVTPKEEEMNTYKTGDYEYIATYGGVSCTFTMTVWAYAED